MTTSSRGRLLFPFRCRPILRNSAFWWLVLLQLPFGPTRHRPLLSSRLPPLLKSLSSENILALTLWSMAFASSLGFSLPR